MEFGSPQSSSQNWVRSERFLIPPLLILVREKTSLSFDVVIESNLPCPLPDIAYGEDCPSQNTDMWTNKRSRYKEEYPSLPKHRKYLGKHGCQKKGHSVEEL